MSDQEPEAPRRASRNVKLVIMGVVGAAVLYSCTPSMGMAFYHWPSFWLFNNPFYRGPMPLQTTTGVGGHGVGSSPASPSSGQTTSSRGGFGATGAAEGAGS
jgi:hypothetical protein